MYGKLGTLAAEAVRQETGFKELEKQLKLSGGPVNLIGVSGVQKAGVLLALMDSPVRPWSGSAAALMICDDEAGARRYIEDINQLAGSVIGAVWAAKDFTFQPVASVSREYEHQRLGVLAGLMAGEIRVVAASAESILQKTLPPELLALRTLTLEAGKNYPPNKLAADLTAAGYIRVLGEHNLRGQIEGPGQFASRGNIMDIFPTQFPAVRLEFWGDDIDTISLLDIESQRRTDSLESVKISPALEVLFESEEAFLQGLSALHDKVKGKRGEKVKASLSRDMESLKEMGFLANIDKYLPLSCQPATLFDYLGDGLVCVSEFRNVEEKAKGYLAQHMEDIKILLEDGELTAGLEGYCLSFPELLSALCKRPLVCMDSFARSNHEVKFKALVNLETFSTSPWGGEVRQLTEDLLGMVKEGYKVLVLAGSEKTLPILAGDLRDGGVDCGLLEQSEGWSHKVLLTTGCLSGGYSYPESRMALITQAKSLTVKRKLQKKRKGEEIKSLSDVSAGDLVVHALHGIGRFKGISKLELEGVTKDYITIQYAGTDVLYVPVTQMDLVSRYIGPKDDAGVKLNKLASAEWQRTRSRVKAAVKDMAKELTALYAKRAATPGHAFPPDDDFQRDFDGRFEYTETDDQLRSIAEIKADMEQPSPMDRLLCGDVGFGKTEVALRAAFKCVLDGKQCCILAPTTVLAWQHYQTAVKRFQHFPIKIQLLSRFRSAKQQTEIIKDVNKGLVELVIGTHRLVQKDVKFKKLGLAIIDEEQRFGVAHKERFKELFNGVDQLTLSATPIPRTLNMAMSGIRDMSVIEEPPIDRYPVQTYVIEHSMSVITQALIRELRRGGQAFYIHNRIDSIGMCAAKLQERLPEARIGIAHGKIGEEELSEIWRQLIEHEIDILVCTTLIETGVDVPNCNTLIIEDSDRLGLSQLYQLRGRVGRSNRRAFAYFTFRKGKIINEIAAKRLDAIREFTQFGSGFRIALRDLEIRGAGSLLGGRQHGHMEAVGYDMYIQLLNEAMAEERGLPMPKAAEDCLVDVQLEAHIPENYIENLAGRLDIYRKIAALTTREEAMDLTDELIDRYGEPPVAIQGLVEVALLRHMASVLGIKEISQRNGHLLFFIAEATPMQISCLTGALKGRVSFNSAARPYISVRLNPKDTIIRLMKQVLELLSN